MKIACIAWGSLVWRPEGLLIQSEWFSDGPILPIEFARQSKDGRLTLVITDRAKQVRTLWALMATDDLTQAKKSLQIREETTENNICAINSTEETNDNIKQIIKNWIISLKIDAAIWTNLPSKFNNENNKTPTVEEAISYLNNLDINTRKTAEEYIRKTPKQIDTEFRRRFEAEFGWTYTDK